MIKNYIWDFDGTLYDSYPVITKTAIEAFAHFGHPISSEQAFYEEIKKESLGRLIKETGIEKAAFDDFFVPKEASRLAEIIPFSETKQVIEGLLEKGAQHFVLTHRKVASTKELLQRDGLLDDFVGILGEDSGFPRKPAPDAILHFVHQFELLPEETLMIGDRRLDVEAGRNAGVKTCLFDPDGFLGQIPADFHISSLEELLHL